MTALFELTFRLFINALVRQRPYHPLRLAIPSPQSPASSSSIVARAVTRFQKVSTRHLFFFSSFYSSCWI
ncbi:hypothetical protein PIB30_053100 [Stylosanthes scabra]|uniref:Secreted protein n=1 Tax=Stylosanthes scabra TaxID=79078 RepID=A0ABU6TI38_9FABA|nr:hypothetical protein [Stylosanthes scabra]